MMECHRVTPLERAIRSAYPLKREVQVGSDTFVLRQPLSHAVRTLLYDLEEKYPLTAMHSPTGGEGSSYDALPPDQKLAVRRQWADYVRDCGIGMARLCLGSAGEGVPDEIISTLIEGHEEFDEVVGTLCGQGPDMPSPSKDDPDPFASPESTG